MKTTRTTFIILISLTLLTSAPALKASPVPIDPATYPAPVKIACVGDSITQGADGGPGADRKGALVLQ